MKYLSGNKDCKYTLIKYTDAYKQDLDQFTTLNDELRNCVEQYPKIYSEFNDHQSYMIYYGRICVGAIYIGTSTNEKDLELKVQFDEKYFHFYDEIALALEKLINSLGLYFYDKENIEIDLINDLDLSKYNGFIFKKKVYDENLTTYIYSNKRNNILIPSIINEMNQTEKKLIEWNQSWTQEFSMCCSKDYGYGSVVPLLQDYANGNVSANEMFYNAEVVSWHRIKSAKSTRNIDFYRDGEIHFNKRSKERNGIYYDFVYHILSDDFRLKTYLFLNKYTLEITDNSIYTKIGLENLNILKIKENQRKRINYKTPIINDSSIEVELWTNEEDVIERCYIDFKTYKGNGKVNGLYALRIIPKSNICTLDFISRDGFKSGDFSKQLVENNEELYSAIFNGDLTYEMIDELINNIIPIINRRAINSSRKTIAQKNNSVISNVTEIEKQVINFIKQIKGEIPLPHLQTILENFAQNNKTKNNSNKKLLKK